MQSRYIYQGPVGNYAVEETDGALSRIWVGDRVHSMPSSVIIKETPLLQKAKIQLDEYFTGKRKIFDLPVALTGTAFQLKVWKSLQSIPYGQTITYGELARHIGDPKACRAVGRANGCNPLPILIPCHRVVGSRGKLTGYTGGLEIKIKLLEIEKLYSVPLSRHF